MHTFLYPQQWTKHDVETFQSYFRTLSNPNNIPFDQKIMQTHKEILGIRIPMIRTLAKHIRKTDYFSFLSYYFPYYHEEYLLKALLIGSIPSMEQLLDYLPSFLKDIDNWAVCDLLVGEMKIVNTHQEEILPFIQTWIHTSHVFTRRVAIVILMKYFLNDQWIDTTLSYIQHYYTDEYYLNMAIGWLLCESFIKYSNKTINMILHSTLHRDALRFTAQKVRDSLRIPKLQKDKLSNLIILQLKHNQKKD